MKYNARVHRDGKFWIIQVDGIGVTQALEREEVEYMARDLVATVLDLTDGDVELDIRYDD